MPRLTQKRKELLGAMMKEAIYEAAVSVMTEHGVEGMTMDRVAAAANMAKGNLYNYFRDKRELLQFIHERMVAPIMRALEEVTYVQMSAIDKLRSVLRTLLEHMAEHYEVMGLMLRSDTARAFLEPAERSLRATGLNYFTTIFRQGIQEGLFRPLDPTDLAQMFVGALAEFAQWRVAAGRPPQVEQTIDTLLGVFLNGIGAKERESP
jgi:AcrR family transcriptional regulator